MRELTEERGVHSARIDESATTWIDIHSASDRLPRAVVRRAAASAFERVGELPIKHDADLESLRIRPVRFVDVKSPSGKRTVT